MLSKILGQIGFEDCLVEFSQKMGTVSSLDTRAKSWKKREF